MMIKIMNTTVSTSSFLETAIAKLYIAMHYSQTVIRYRGPTRRLNDRIISNSPQQIFSSSSGERKEVDLQTSSRYTRVTTIYLDEARMTHKIAGMAIAARNRKDLGR